MAARSRYRRRVQAPDERPVRVRRTWDLVLTVVLLIAMAAVAVVAAFGGVFLVFVTDSCGSVGRCNDAAVTSGVLTGAVGPLVVALIAAVVAVVRLVRRRMAFWVPVVGLVLIVAVLVLGYLLTASGVPGFQE